MPDSRRTSSRDRASGPRRDARPRAAGAARRPPRQVAARPGPKTAAGERQHRPRLTGRAAILVLVIAVLLVSYASSLRAYRQQRGQIDDLQQQIAQRQASIGTLQDEKDRWNDPAYVEMRARLLGYVMPGEVPYSVTKDGAPLSAESTLGDPATIDPALTPPWWQDAWDSVELAGHPDTAAAH